MARPRGRAGMLYVMYVLILCMDMLCRWAIHKANVFIDKYIIAARLLACQGSTFFVCYHNMHECNAYKYAYT